MKAPDQKNRTCPVVLLNSTRNFRCSLSCCLAALWLIACAAIAQVVDIPDPGLRWAIRQTLNKPTSDITVADMESLTKLDASFSVHLGSNRLTDFSFLSGLTNLTTLGLPFNGLTNLTLPSGLNSLATLELQGNRLTDFSFLSELPSLATLDLSWPTAMVAWRSAAIFLLRCRPVDRSSRRQPVSAFTHRPERFLPREGRRVVNPELGNQN